MNQELKCDPKLSNVDKNHYLQHHHHKWEEVQINGKTIFICPPNHSYQIKKVIEGNKITYEIKK